MKRIQKEIHTDELDAVITAHNVAGRFLPGRYVPYVIASDGSVIDLGEDRDYDTREQAIEAAYRELAY